MISSETLTFVCYRYKHVVKGSGRFKAMNGHSSGILAPIAATAALSRMRIFFAYLKQKMELQKSKVRTWQCILVFLQRISLIICAYIEQVKPQGS